jgi:signal transduction histidine kinase
MSTKFRILVVDDEAPVIESYKTILGRPSGGSGELAALEDELFGPGAEQMARVQGPEFVLDACRQGEDAVTKVKRARLEQAPYSVIFMDARMPPGIDGITAAHAIREIDPYVIIVLVTAYSDIDLSGIIGSGIPALRFLYLAKPFQPQEIIQLATALSLQWDAERSHRAELQGKNDALTRMLEEEAWLRKAAESAQRAKLALFATVGHELRTPLNAVIGFSEIMRAGGASIPNPIYRDYVDEIHTAGRSLLDAINAILEVAEVESGMLRPSLADTDLASTLAMVLIESAPYARKRGVEISFPEVPPVACVLRADPSQLTRALRALVHNAIKFSPAGSTVTVELQAKQDRLEVRIADEGCGMAKNELETLLQPFEQGEKHLARRHEGLGLGLGLAKGLLELQDGCLTVQSAPGRGTIVVVHLPRAVAASRCA